MTSIQYFQRVLCEKNKKIEESNHLYTKYKYAYNCQDEFLEQITINGIIMSFRANWDNE